MGEDLSVEVGRALEIASARPDYQRIICNYEGPGAWAGEAQSIFTVSIGLVALSYYLMGRFKAQKNSQRYG